MFDHMGRVVERLQHDYFLVKVDGRKHLQPIQVEVSLLAPPTTMAQSTTEGAACVIERVAPAGTATASTTAATASVAAATSSTTATTAAAGVHHEAEERGEPAAGVRHMEEERGSAAAGVHHELEE